MLSDAIFYDRFNIICQFLKPFLDKKNIFLRDMEPLRGINTMLSELFTSFLNGFTIKEVPNKLFPFRVNS